jgi:hypothetical protein
VTSRFEVLVHQNSGDMVRESFEFKEGFPFIVLDSGEELSPESESVTYELKKQART